MHLIICLTHLIIFFSYPQVSHYWNQVLLLRRDNWKAKRPIQKEGGKGPATINNQAHQQRKQLFNLFFSKCVLLFNYFDFKTPFLSTVKPWSLFQSFNHFKIHHFPSIRHMVLLLLISCLLTEHYNSPLIFTIFSYNSFQNEHGNLWNESNSQIDGIVWRVSICFYYWNLR